MGLLVGELHALVERYIFLVERYILMITRSNRTAVTVWDSNQRQGAHCDRGDRAGPDRPVGRRHHGKHYHHGRDGCCGHQPPAGVEAIDPAVN